MTTSAIAEREPERRTIAEQYRRHIRGTGREARFLIALAFLVTYAIRYHRLPFLHDTVTKSGLHIHHFVYGIIVLLGGDFRDARRPRGHGRALLVRPLARPHAPRFIGHLAHPHRVNSPVA